MIIGQMLIKLQHLNASNLNINLEDKDNNQILLTKLMSNLLIKSFNENYGINDEITYSIPIKKKIINLIFGSEENIKSLFFNEDSQSELNSVITNIKNPNELKNNDINQKHYKKITKNYQAYIKYFFLNLNPGFKLDYIVKKLCEKLNIEFFQFINVDIITDNQTLKEYFDLNKAIISLLYTDIFVFIPYDYWPLFSYNILINFIKYQELGLNYFDQLDINNDQSLLIDLPHNELFNKLRKIRLQNLDYFKKEKEDSSRYDDLLDTFYNHIVQDNNYFNNSKEIVKEFWNNKKEKIPNQILNKMYDDEIQSIFQDSTSLKKKLLDSIVISKIYYFDTYIDRILIGDIKRKFQTYGYENVGKASNQTKFFTITDINKVIELSKKDLRKLDQLEKNQLLDYYENYDLKEYKYLIEEIMKLGDLEKKIEIRNIPMETFYGDMINDFVINKKLEFEIQPENQYETIQNYISKLIHNRLSILNNDMIRFKYYKTIHLEFYCSEQDITISKYYGLLFNLFISFRKELIKVNGKLVLRIYEETDKEYELNNRFSLIFPHNIIQIQSTSGTLGLFIMPSDDSIIHNLFNNSFIKETNRIKVNLFGEEKEFIIDLPNNDDISNLFFTDHVSLAKQRTIYEYINSKLITDLLHVNLNEFYINLNKEKDDRLKNFRIITKFLENFLNGKIKANYCLGTSKPYFTIHSVVIEQIFKYKNKRLILSSTLTNKFINKISINETANLVNEKNNPDIYFNLNQITIKQGNVINYDYINQEIINPQPEPDIMMDIQEKDPDAKLISIKKQKMKLRRNPIKIMRIKSNIKKSEDDQIMDNMSNFIRNNNKKIFICLNSFSFGRLNYDNKSKLLTVMPKSYEYIIKIQSEILQYVIFQYRNFPNFQKDYDIKFDITLRYNNDTTFTSSLIDDKTGDYILNPIQKFYENDNDPLSTYDDNSFANIFLSNSSSSEKYFGNEQINNIYSENTSGAKFSRNYSNHFEHFFQFINKNYINRNMCSTESGIDLLFLNRKSKDDTIITIKPYNIFVFHGVKNQTSFKKKPKKQPEPKEPPKEIEPKSKKELEKELKSGKDKPQKKKPDEEEKKPKIPGNNVFDQLNMIIKKFPEKENILLNNKFQIIRDKFFNDWQKFQKYSHIFLDSYYYDKKNFPLLKEFILYYTEKGSAQGMHFYSQTLFMLSKYFDYYYLNEICTSISILIHIQHKNQPITMGISKIYELNDIEFELPDKGNDPFLNGYIFYDIENQLVNEMIFKNTKLTDNEIKYEINQKSKQIANYRLLSYFELIREIKLLQKKQTLLLKAQQILLSKKPNLEIKKEISNIETEKINTITRIHEAFNELSIMGDDFYEEYSNIKGIIPDDKIVEILIELKAEYMIKLQEVKNLKEKEAYLSNLNLIYSKVYGKKNHPDRYDGEIARKLIRTLMQTYNDIFDLNVPENEINNPEIEKFKI